MPLLPRNAGSGSSRRTGRWRGRIAPSVIVVSALVAAGCGSSGHAKRASEDTASANAATGSTSNQAGTLTMGYDLTGTAGGPHSFDPAQDQVATYDFATELPIYSTLLRPTSTGQLLPELATGATIVNPQTIQIQLRPGATFSDGTPFSAEAVKAGLERNLATKHRSAFHAVFFDVSSIDVTGPDSLTVHLSKPVAGAWYPILADEESFIVSPAAANNPAVDLNKTPVGAGPFLLKRDAPGQEIIYGKNLRYWDANHIHLATLDVRNVPSGPQQVNALKAGTVDVEMALPPDALAAVKTDSALSVTSSIMDGQFLWMPLCKSTAPLNDVHVRQALSYAIDRNAINKVVLNGTGQPAWSLWPQKSPDYDSSLTNHYAYNPAKARQLLAAAGHRNDLHLSVVPLPTPLDQRVTQIIQAEWQQIGVTLTIVPTTDYVNDFYLRHVAPIGLISSTRPGLDKLSGPFVPGSIGNACQYNNPAINQVVAQLTQAQPGGPASIAAWKQAQQYVIQNALAIYIDYVPVISASAKNVHGFQLLSYIGAVPDLWSVSVTK